MTIHHSKFVPNLYICLVVCFKFLLSKWHGWFIFRSRRLNTSAHCVLVWELPRKTKYSQSTGWNNALLTWRRQSKMGFSRGPRSPMASGCPLAAYAGQLALMPRSWAVYQKDPIPFPYGTVEQWGWPTAVWHTCWSRTKEYILSLKQRKMFPHWVTRPAQAVRTVPLWKEVFPAYWGWAGVEKLHPRDPFPNSFNFSIPPP